MRDIDEEGTMGTRGPKGNQKPVANLPMIDLTVKRHLSRAPAAATKNGNLVAKLGKTCLIGNNHWAAAIRKLKALPRETGTAIPIPGTLVYFRV